MEKTAPEAPHPFTPTRSLGFPAGRGCRALGWLSWSPTGPCSSLQAGRTATLPRVLAEGKVHTHRAGPSAEGGGPPDRRGRDHGRRIGAAAGRSWCGRMPQPVKCLTMRDLQAVEPCFGHFLVRQPDAPEGESAGIGGVREGRHEIVM